MKFSHFLIGLMCLLIVLVIPASAAITKTTSFFEDGGNNYTIIKWTTNLTAGSGQDSTTWDADAAGATEVEYLVVAGGGGGGGGYYAGGGGAGGMRTATGFAVSGTIPVNVGAGGTGGLAGNPSEGAATPGSNSEFSTVVSTGGGRGGDQPSRAGGDGGSGGGGSGSGTSGSYVAGSASPPGQGHDGGTGHATAGYGGGGGGASEDGEDVPDTTHAGDGGDGSASSITGASVTYAGGGGGGAQISSYGDGGAGGGGRGGDNAFAPVSGTNGFGGGGGGSGLNTVGTGVGGAGGSGVVIVRFLTPSFSLSANFTASNTSGIHPLPVAFTDTSTTTDATIDAWMWDFGDGDTSTDQNPDHTYVSAGTYVANLTITNTSLSLVSTKIQTVTVYGIPVADFSGTPTYDFAPMNVSFTDTSTGTGINAWLWNFGDGYTSTEQNPYHVYNTEGNKTVSLTVTNPYASDTETKTEYISVWYRTFSNFTANNTAPTVYTSEVLFTPECTDCADRFLWDWGEGEGTFLSHNGTETHIYQTPGLKSVTLTAYRSDNVTATNTTTRVDYINASYDPNWVHADFSATPTSGGAGVSISFTDLSEWGTSDALSGRTYLWDFGDTGTSNVTGDTSHVYSGYGTYTVRLSINNTLGLDNETKTNYIIVSSSQQTTWYTPTQMRLQTVTNPYGTPIAGVLVTATPMNFTAPADWTQTLIGIQPSVNMSGTTLYGTTGTDGSWVAPVLQSYLYHFTFTNASAGINQESYFYPVDPYYRIFIDTGVATNYTYSQITGTNLTFSQPNTSYITVGMNYQDTSSLTENVTFTVEDWKNGTVFYTQTFTSGFVTSSVSSSYTFPNTRGDEFIWKYVAYRSDGSILTQGNGGTSKGPSGVGVDLGLPLDWYKWISICIIFLIGSMSSQRTKQYWAILIPIFAAIFMWWGWFTGTQNVWGLIVLCAVFGAIIYMKSALREKHGVGGPGSMLINIVAYLIIIQACIGFVNGLAIWDASLQSAISSPYQNVDITTDIPTMAAAGGILGDAIAMSQFVFDLWFGLMKALWAVLTAIAVIYPSIIDMFPFIESSAEAKALLVLFQLGIWFIYLIFAYKFFRGELGTVEL